MIEASGRLDAAHRALVLAVTVVALMAFDSAALPSANGSTAELVSVNSAGTGSGNNISGPAENSVDGAPVISANGRYVAFQSRATNLVALSDNNFSSEDVFVRDLQTNTTTLVSIRSDGMGSGNGVSRNPSISGDGRYVAFESTANNLVAITHIATSNVFVRDLQTNTTILVSINSGGTATANNQSTNPVISENGQFVAFVSLASNLTTIPVDGIKTQIYVRDLIGMTTALASVNASGTGGGNQPSTTPIISADGRVVVFPSNANNLTPNDTNGYIDIYARDLLANTTTLVSANGAGTGTGNNESFGAKISKDGKIVAFLSLATNLLPEDTTEQADVYARELPTGALELISANTMGVAGGGYANSIAINADGRYIAFESQGNDLVPNDNGYVDVFVRDRVADTTEWVSVSRWPGVNANGNSTAPAISDDGRFISFVSNAQNLTGATPDNFSFKNVYVRDLVADTTALLSPNSTNTGGGNDASGLANVISADGMVVAFTSKAGDLVTNDSNGLQDVFATSFRGGLLEFSDDGYSVNENDGTANLTVNRQGGSAGEVSIAYETINETAQLGSDYDAGSGMLTFADGETSKTIMLPIVDDNLYEGDETFIVRLKSPTGEAVLGALSETQVTIIEDDSLPQVSVSVNDVSVTEGNSGFINATFTVSLSNPSLESVVVDYTTASGTATDGKDYNSHSGTASFNPGQTTTNVSVQVLADDRDEVNETFFLNLSNPVNATIADGHGISTIIDNDPLPNLNILNVMVTEGNTGTVNALFKVHLSNYSGKTVKVHYATANGTARSGSDYTFTSGTLTFLPGHTTETISVPVKGDTIDEANKSFFVNLSSPINATIFNGRGTGTILDNDASPRLAINNVTVTEGNSGAINASFTVSLSAASGQVVTVHFATGNGTATAPADYTAKSATLTFTPGQTVKTVVIQVKGDTIREPNETFKVILDSATNATFADSQGVCTIINND